MQVFENICCVPVARMQRGRKDCIEVGQRNVIRKVLSIIFTLRIYDI